MEHDKRERRLNLIYILINASYFIMLCATGSYVYNFLLECRYADGTAVADGTAGIIIASIYILTVFVQAKLGDLVDSSDKVDEKLVITVLLILVTALAMGMALIKNASLLLFAVLVLCYTCASAVSPFINSMAFIYVKEGITINYGLGRGMGSASFGLASLLVGRLWSSFGKVFVPYYVAITAVLTLLIVHLLPKSEENSQIRTKKSTNHISYGEFFRRYRIVVPVALAMVMLYFGANMINTYMAKIIANVLSPEAAAQKGVIATIQGRMLFVQAIAELPFMFGYYLVRRHFSVKQLSMIGASAFLIKFVIVTMARSPMGLYLAMCMQMFSYALLAPSVVYFVQETVRSGDRNKGQALMGATSTVAAFLGSLIGGQLLQLFGVTMVTRLALGVIACGVVLMFYGMGGVKEFKK